MNAADSNAWVGLRLEPLDTPYTAIGDVRATPTHVVFSAGSPTQGLGIVRLALWAALGLFVRLVVLLAAALTTAPAVDDLGARVDRFARAHGGRPLPLSADAPLLREAVVATEDERFYGLMGSI